MTEQHAPDLDVTHARQALRGVHALVILVVSLLLAVLVVFGAWAYFSGPFAAEHARAPSHPASRASAPGLSAS